MDFFVIQKLKTYLQVIQAYVLKLKMVFYLQKNTVLHHLIKLLNLKTKDVKNYMFNRLKMSEGEIELPDPIIMENDKLMK